MLRNGEPSSLALVLVVFFWTHMWGDVGGVSLLQSSGQQEGTPLYKNTQKFFAAGCCVCSVWPGAGLEDERLKSSCRASQLCLLHSGKLMWVHFCFFEQQWPSEGSAGTARSSLCAT